MPKIDWYEWRAGQEKPIHAEYSPTRGTVFVRGDDPMLSSHVAFGHEAAHVKLDAGSSLAGEFLAWEETIYNLMRADEWTPEAKEQVIWALSSYTEEAGEGVNEAKWWIDRAEGRARRRLLRG